MKNRPVFDKRKTGKLDRTICQQQSWSRTQVPRLLTSFHHSAEILQTTRPHTMQKHPQFPGAAITALQNQIHFFENQETWAVLSFIAKLYIQNLNHFHLFPLLLTLMPTLFPFEIHRLSSLLRSPPAAYFSASSPFTPCDFGWMW